MLVAVFESSNLTENDWQVADFFVLYNAIRSTAKQEVWLIALIVAEGSIIHGSLNRKLWLVVFDDTLNDFTTLVSLNNIVSSFLMNLQITA